MALRHTNIIVNEGCGVLGLAAEVAGGLTMPAALPYPVRAGGSESVPKSNEGEAFGHFETTLDPDRRHIDNHI